MLPMSMLPMSMLPMCMLPVSISNATGSSINSTIGSPITLTGMLPVCSHT